MASVTDTYLPRYQELINKTNDLQTPTGYENVTNLYAKSLESEMESNTQFRNYLLTGNTTESEASEQSCQMHLDMKWSLLKHSSQLLMQLIIK